MDSPTSELVAAPGCYALEVVPFNLSVPTKSRSVTKTGKCPELRIFNYKLDLFALHLHGYESMVAVGLSNFVPGGPVSAGTANYNLHGILEVLCG